VNALNNAVDIPLAGFQEINDALRRADPMAYQTLQDTLPLQGAWGLTMETGPALDWASAWASTTQGAGETLLSLPPELENSLASELETGVQSELPSIQEEAATVFQDRLSQVIEFLRKNPDQILKLGRTYWGGEVSAAQLNAAGYKYAGGDPSMAKAIVGNAVEALLNAINESEQGAGWFEQASGGGRIDFIGKGIYEGLSFEVTTEFDAPGHIARIYMQQQGAMIFTYSFDLPF
jgi:hypothetical protein